MESLLRGRNRRLCVSAGAIPPTLDPTLIALGFSASPASTPGFFGQEFSSPLQMNMRTGFV